MPRISPIFVSQIQNFSARIDFLADKANEGTLSPVEAQEYEKTAEYMDFIALLRLKTSAVACANGT